MSLINTPPIIRKESWESAVEFSVKTRQALQQLTHLRLGYDSHPVFEDITIDSLTATRLIQSDANKKLTSVSDLTNWVSGTANEIDITDDGDGTITIGIVNPLIVGKGGTGAATLTDHSILVGSGTAAITALTAATNGQLPIGSTGADPTIAALTGTANQITVTNGAGSITLSTPQDIATDSSPTFVDLTLTGDLLVSDSQGVLAGTGGVDSALLLKAGSDAGGGVIDYVLLTLEGSSENLVFQVTDGSSITFSPGNITTSTGTIDFNDENLTTDGALTASNYTAANLLTACATSAGSLDFSSDVTLTVAETETTTNYHTDARAATWLANNHETTYTHTDIALNTTHRGSDGSDHTHIDQAVTQAASPTFAGASLGTGELTCGSINRAADTLTLEINGTAEVSITATTVTLGGNLIIPDNGTIGSVSDTNVMTIDASGNTTFSVFPITPSAAPDADYEVANKKYVDDNVAAATTWIGLTDTDPANYTGEAGNCVVVNAGEDGLEFGAAPGGGGNFVDRGDPAAVDFNEDDLTIDHTWRDLDLAASAATVPAGAVAVLLNVRVKDAGTAGYIQFRKNGNANAVAVALVRGVVANVRTYETIVVACDANRVIEYDASGCDEVDIIVTGWWTA